LNIVSQTLQFSERILFDLYLTFREERKALITFLFHGLFKDQDEIRQNWVHPQQGITVAQFRQFIEYYLGHNYHFVSPEDIVKGLEPQKNYVLITFDDGYYNNVLALPVLEECRVPAVFFITANNVKYYKAFWWDVLYRERTKSGISPEKQNEEKRILKKKTHREIEAYLVDAFGKDCLQPLNDVDRPFTPGELKEFSAHPYVHIGNHTCDHAILTNYTRDGIREQISAAQKVIEEMTAIVPQSIAYPNGNYSEEIGEISRQVGLKLGITTSPRKNYLPLNLKGNHSMRLQRFILWGNGSIIKQCRLYRSDIREYLHNLKTKRGA